MSLPSIIYLGADHAGFVKKESIKRFLLLEGFEVEDLGAHEIDPSDDFPVYAARVANVVRNNPRAVGLLFCGSAEGVCIAANKFDGIRAGIGFSVESAQSLRTDDYGNILCLPGRLSTQDNLFAIVNAFLTAKPDSAPRRERREEQIKNLENIE